MTIQEAIKSGKPFRRKGWCRFYDNLCDLNCYIYAMANGNTERRLSYVDFLADDWEIKQEPREIFLYFDLDTGRWTEAKNPKCHQEVIKVREVIE